MKTTISKRQWKFIGEKAGWLKTAMFDDDFSGMFVKTDERVVTFYDESHNVIGTETFFVTSMMPHLVEKQVARKAEQHARDNFGYPGREITWDISGSKSQQIV
jgi:hypothetical protein